MSATRPAEDGEGRARIWPPLPKTDSKLQKETWLNQFSSRKKRLLSIAVVSNSRAPYNGVMAGSTLAAVPCPAGLLLSCLQDKSGKLALNMLMTGSRVSGAACWSHVVWRE